MNQPVQIQCPAFLLQLYLLCNLYLKPKLLYDLIKLNYTAAFKI
jgi:hypothetical protein